MRTVLYHLLNIAKREFSSVLVINIKIVGIKFSLEISLALLCDPIIRGVGLLDEFCVGQLSTSPRNVFAGIVDVCADDAW
jgi:hypothetical protein